MKRLRALDRIAPWVLIPAVILWVIRPLVLHCWDSVVSTEALYGAVWLTIEPDIWFQIWVLAWGSHVLVTAPWALYQANAFHPTADVLARSDHLLGILPLFAPAYLATSNPVFAFQTAMIASYLLCGVTLFLLLRHFDCSRAVSTGFAILWALVNWRLEDGLARAQLLQYQYLPLIVLFFDRYLERGGVRNLFGGALFLAWQCLTAYWHAYFAVFTTVVTIAVSAWSAGPGRDSRRYARALAAFAVVAASFAVLSLPYVEIAREGQLIPKSAPAQLSWYFGSPSVPYAVAVLALAGIGLIARSRDVRTARGCAVLALVAAAGILLSLPIPGDAGGVLDRVLSWPRQLAIAAVPGFRYLRDEYRFLTLASFGIYGLAAIAADRAARALAQRSWWLAVAAGVVFFGVSSARLAHVRIPLRPAPATVAAPPVYEWLRDHGAGGVVLELPVSRNLADAHIDARYMFFSTYHWLPLVNGYTGHPPREFYAKVRSLAPRIPDPRAVDALEGLTGLRWIVVHDDARRAFDDAGELPASSQLRRVGDFDGARLYEVLQFPKSQPSPSR